MDLGLEDFAHDARRSSSDRLEISIPDKEMLLW